jgi:hypothetical protein
MDKKIIMTLAALLIWEGGAHAQVTAARYSAPPMTGGLNRTEKRGYSAGSATGALHELALKIFEGTGTRPQYSAAASASYNMAVQNAMLAGSTQNGADFVLGAAFDENNLKFLDYIPVPIYDDFLTLVVAKSSIPAGFTPGREIDAAIAALSQSASPVGIAGLRLDVPEQTLKKKFEKMTDAMESIFTERSFLIAPWSFVSGYLSADMGGPRAENLLVLKFQKRRSPYFLAVGRGSRNKSVEGRPEPLGAFLEKRLEELQSSGELGRIIPASG